MSCKYAYSDYISCGNEEIVLETDLTPGQEYEIIITHPNGSKYSVTETVDAFGSLTFSLSGFPNGLFNPYAGKFTLHLEGGCDDVLFCDYYKYIEFEVVNGNQVKNTLSCCAPGSESPSAACCVTETHPFEDEAITVIPYTGTRPSIEVAYLNGDGSYTLAGISTTVTFQNNEFTIDHGGIASGIIKTMK